MKNKLILGSKVTNWKHNQIKILLKNLGHLATLQSSAKECSVLAFMWMLLNAKTIAPPEDQAYPHSTFTP